MRFTPDCPHPLVFTSESERSNAVLANSTRSRRSRVLQRWLRQWHPARERLQRDPLGRILSVAEIPIAVDLGISIDVNQATVDDWLRLPGLSIHQARALTELNRRGVDFHCLEDIAAALGVPVRSLRPLEPLLHFCYYDRASVSQPAPLPLNTAPPEHLIHLPGMTPSLLNRLVWERQRSPFRTWAEVQRRLSLQPEQTSHWMHVLFL